MTNKNKIAIAPTYTIKIINAIKSTSKRMKSTAAFIKAAINQSTECTEFSDEITKIPEISKNIQNISTPLKIPKGT